MTNKNPFELRTELLQMSKEMLDKQFDAQMELAKHAAAVWEQSGKDAKEFLTEVTPKMYSPECIMENARELYKFVSKKD